MVLREHKAVDVARPTSEGCERAASGRRADWWRSAVVYQVYPRSFADCDGDGVGDLGGLRSNLDHLSWLGVDAMWLSPIYPSPMADFGYDVSDYCTVDPVFGTLSDVDGMVDDCHRRGIRVILDWVPNHTSDRHAWFVDARRGRDAAFRQWYTWRDPASDGGPPNNWIRAWSGSPAWTFDEASGQYYLHCYLPEQPDLNWLEPAVEAAMHGTLRFWLDRGIDGFRADVVHLIGKDSQLSDLAGSSSQGPASRRLVSVYTHVLLRRIRTLLDSYPHHPMMVGEVVLFDPGRVASYYGDDDELHQVFDFRPIKSPWSWGAFRRRAEETQREFGDRRWPTRVLGNHDNPRQRTRFGTDDRARAAAVMLLTGRGTPYLYAGEELGLPDAMIALDRSVDPGGRDGCRAPIPWSEDAGHGWPADPWLPFVDGAAEYSVERQRRDPASILHLYRDLIALRRRSAALRDGAEELLELEDPVLAWIRHSGDERVVVAINFSEEPQRIETTGLLLASSVAGRARRRPFDGHLGGDEAVVVMAAT